MRRGRAEPCLPEACQVNAALAKKNSYTKVQLILFAESGLNTLTPSLKGSGRPWETIPLNNFPFLKALVLAILPNVCVCSPNV